MGRRAFVPPFLVFFGLLLSVVMAVEVGAFVVTPRNLDTIMLVNLVSALPFVAVLVGIGYFLYRDGPDLEHARFGVWVLGGTLYFLAFFSLVAILGEDDLLVQFQIVRWSVAAGAGSGALVGFFELRAIERAVSSERVRHRNEQLRHEKERLDEFASIISHDLRNPLNVAEGYLELLATDYEDDRFERVTNAHDRMHQIIEDTLILARGEKHIDEPERVELERIVTECWSTVETADAELDMVGNATFHADPQQLRRLFENLIRNAVEHCREDVTVRVTATTDGFMFEDDGPGIPPEEREQVFEAGYSTADRGVGFGLRIVKHVVDAHGWEIELTEGDLGGARFDITGVELTDDEP